VNTAGAGLVETYRGTVYPWHCDHMNHMNVMWYVGKFDEATWNLFAMLGMSAAWLREHGRGMAAIDQRIAYQRELHAGDTVFVRSGLLEVGAKVVRFFHEMVHAESGHVCAVTQLVGAHLDTTARRAVAWPDEWIGRARERLVQHALPWEARASTGGGAPTLAA
jgi:acyl-CoA thioester hydrolase